MKKPYSFQKNNNVLAFLNSLHIFDMIFLFLSDCKLHLYISPERILFFKVPKLLLLKTLPNFKSILPPELLSYYIYSFIYIFMYKIFMYILCVCLYIKRLFYISRLMFTLYCFKFWDHYIKEKIILFIISSLQTRFESFTADIQLQRYFSVTMGLCYFV